MRRITRSPTFGLEPWTLEETRERVRGSMRDSFPALFGARWREAGEVFYRRFTERHMQTLQPCRARRSCWRNCTANGLYLAIVSNKKGDYLRKEAAHIWDGIGFSAESSAHSMRPATSRRPIRCTWRWPAPVSRRARGLVRGRCRYRPRMCAQCRLCSSLAPGDWASPGEFDPHAGDPRGLLLGAFKGAAKSVMGAAGVGCRSMSTVTRR